MLNGDKIRLQQVLINIVKNSLKYSRDKGTIKIYAAYHEEEEELRVMV